MSFLRTAKIALGITLTSALAGAVTGVVTLGLLITLTDGPRALFDNRYVYAVAAVIGGGCGLLLGPMAAFGFLRRVPLGRLFGETMVGTVVGGLAGSLASIGLVGALACGGCGFLAAALRLAWTHRASPQAELPG